MIQIPFVAPGIATDPDNVDHWWATFTGQNIHMTHNYIMILIVFQWKT